MEVLIYRAADGSCPFEDWLNSLKDTTLKSRILARLVRVRAGNLGDWKTLTDHSPLLELRDHKGFRLYCVRRNQTLMILLCGGLKASQEKDIRKAEAYWHEYSQRPE